MLSIIAIDRAQMVIDSGMQKPDSFYNNRYRKNLACSHNSGLGK
jgi:hypothetical protein